MNKPNNLPFSEDVNMALGVVYQFLGNYAPRDGEKINFREICNDVRIYVLPYMAELLVADMFTDYPPIEELKEEFLSLLVRFDRECDRNRWHIRLIIASCIVKIRNSIW